jgi:hypothetical protein
LGDILRIKRENFAPNGKLLLQQLHAPPKKSELLSTVPREGGYETSSSELESCGLAGIGLISLALNPASVEEQAVASTTTTASITAVNATCRRRLKKAPERSLLNNPGAAGGHIVFMIC